MIEGMYLHKAKIKSSGVLYYKVWDGERTKKMLQCDLIKNFDGKKQVDELGNEVLKEKRSTYCGQVTKGTLKRMVDMAHLFCEVCPNRWINNKYSKKRVKHKFSFITLTIPMNERKIEGREGYKNLLQPFIFWLTKTKKVNTYFWKAELQQPLDFQGRLKQSLGQLHYHVLIPNWIDKKEISEKWNYLLKENNYSNEYFEKHGHYNTPSARIERPYKVKNVADYVIKEITKNCISSKDVKNIELLLEKATEKGQNWRIELLSNELDRLNILQEIANIPLGGKVWGCSQNLQPKKILKPNKEEEEKDLSEKIEKHKKQIENYINDFGKTCNINVGYDVLNWHKLQLNWLNKKYNCLFRKEKNYFEVEYDETFEKRLNYTYNHYKEKGVFDHKTKEYKDVGFWEKNKNIYENDFIVMYKLPNDYKDILLDKKHKIVQDGQIKEVFYKDEYREFLKNRVGVVYTEKTLLSSINSN